MSFTKSLLIAPITALHFPRDTTLLAGEGPVLHVYDVNSLEEVDSATVLPHTSIHGMKSDSGRHGNEIHVCVFGSKSVRIVSLTEPGQSVQCLTHPREFEDWVWDVQWLPHCDEGIDSEDSCLALALGHNAVLEWQWRRDVILRRVQCEEQCLLYCAKLIGSSWEHLIVAAGTVFNQAALWSVGGHFNSTKHAKVLHRLTGHQGVIFAIDFHRDRLQICSASDDRSIRLWQLRLRGGEVNVSSELTMTDWEGVTFEPLFVYYGHSARVWGVRLLHEHIVSVGEDATCLIWNYSGEIVQKFKGHKGKSIWSLAVSPSEATLATGGGDSSVRLWRHPTGGSELNQRCRQRTLCLPQDYLSSQLPDEDFPRSVQLLADHSLLIMTDRGSLWLHELTSGQSVQLLRDARFASYSVLALSPDGHWVLLGSVTGWLRVLTSRGQEVDGGEVVRSGSYQEQIHQNGKIHAICWLTSNAETDCYQFLTTGPDGALLPGKSVFSAHKHARNLALKWLTHHMGLPTIWRLCFDLTTSVHEVSIQRLYQFQLPYAKQRWVTVALLLVNSGILVCGDRGGTIHMFRLTGQQQNPQLSLNKIHGKAGVTDIHYHENHVYSCGRDGQLRKYSVDDDGLHLLCSNKVLKGFDWVSRLLFHADDLLVLGFHTDQFIVYSTARNQRLLTVACGGGHRAWDFVLPDNGDGRFVFIKHKEIVVCDASFLANQSILKPSLHGREMNDVKYLSSNTDNSSFLLATAGEDTVVNLLRVTMCPTGNGHHRSTYRVVASMQAHISSVRALCVSSPCPSPDSRPGDPDSHPGDQSSHPGDIILFSAGGRAQLNAWKIYFQKDSAGCGVEAGKRSTRKESGESACVTEPCFGMIQKPAECNVSCDSGADTGETKSVTGSTNVTQEDPAMCKTRTINGTGEHCCLAKDNTQTCNDGTTRHGGSSEATGGATCRYKHLAGHMLQQKGRRHRKPWKKATYDSSTETRYMSVCAFSTNDVDPSLSPRVHVLTAACSDGYIRIFRFDEVNPTFCLVAQSDFHDHCVLTVRHLIVSTSANQRRAYIISAGTDGRIAFWDITDIATECVQSEEQCSSDEESEHFQCRSKQASTETLVSGSYATTVEEGRPEIRTMDTDSVDVSNSLTDNDITSNSIPSECNIQTGGDFSNDKFRDCNMDGNDRNFAKDFPRELHPVLVVEAHQSGVNALDVRIVKEGGQARYVVASGGDDNAISVCVVTQTETGPGKPPTLQLLDATKMASAHSAQITGVKILDDSTVVTSSIDQRVTLWSLLTQPKLQLKIRGSHCIGVADAISLDVFTYQNGANHLAVCGVGLECLEMT